MASQLDLLDRLGISRPLTALPGDTVAQALLRNFVPPMTVSVELDGAPVPDSHRLAAGRRYVARLIRREAEAGGRPFRSPFWYLDKGSMATIGRSRAIAWARGVVTSDAPGVESTIARSLSHAGSRGACTRTPDAPMAIAPSSAAGPSQPIDGRYGGWTSASHTERTSGCRVVDRKPWSGRARW